MLRGVHYCKGTHKNKEWINGKKDCNYASTRQSGTVAGGTSLQRSARLLQSEATDLLRRELDRAVQSRTVQEARRGIEGGTEGNAAAAIPGVAAGEIREKPAEQGSEGEYFLGERPEMQELTESEAET